MEELRQALKSYRQMAADMAEFADEDHLELNDKIAVVIKLQNGALAFSVAVMQATIWAKKDFHVHSTIKYLARIIYVIKEQLTKVMDTNQEKLWQYFRIVQDQLDLLVQEFECTSDYKHVHELKKNIEVYYFDNEVK